MKPVMKGNTAEVTIKGITQEVVSFVPDSSDRKLAIVDLSVLLRLTESLGKVPFEVIKNALVSKIRESQNLEEYVATLENEAAFHKTVNLITEVKVIEGEVVMSVPVDYQMAP